MIDGRDSQFTINAINKLMPFIKHSIKMAQPEVKKELEL